MWVRIYLAIGNILFWFAIGMISLAMITTEMTRLIPTVAERTSTVFLSIEAVILILLKHYVLDRTKKEYFGKETKTKIFSFLISTIIIIMPTIASAQEESELQNNTNSVLSILSNGTSEQITVGTTPIVEIPLQEDRELSSNLYLSQEEYRAILTEKCKELKDNHNAFTRCIMYENCKDYNKRDCDRFWEIELPEEKEEYDGSWDEAPEDIAEMLENDMKTEKIAIDKVRCFFDPSLRKEKGIKCDVKLPWNEKFVVTAELVGGGAVVFISIRIPAIAFPAGKVYYDSIAWLKEKSAEINRRRKKKNKKKDE